MKILYGVVGEGMGHAMRSRVVLEHLVAQSTTSRSWPRGARSTSSRKRFEGVNRIHGLHMIYEENRVRRGKTLWSNVLDRRDRHPEEHRRVLRAHRRASSPTS